MIAFTALLLISCETEEPVVNQQLSRLFRPGSFSRLVEGTTVTLSWQPIKNATYYIEYGKAEAGVPFEEIEELAAITLGRVSAHKIENLWGSTRYAIRIKAVSTIEGVNDSEYVNSNFTTGAENIFYPLAFEYNGTDFTILVKWEAEKDVSHITINNLQLGEKIISLSAEDITIGEKRIASTTEYRLRSGQQYTIAIYLNTRKRGENSITLQRP